MTKIKDLKGMSREELDSKLIELRKEMIKQNSQIATGTTPKSPGQVKEIKKTIAKILTIKGSEKDQKKKKPETKAKAEKTEG